MPRAVFSGAASRARAGVLAVAVAAMLPGAALAQPGIPYQSAGSQSLPTAFVAATSGNVVAYFAGSDAAYTETLGLLVNGVPTGVTGLNNHASALGSSLNLGYAPAGASLTFFIHVQNTGATYYSNPSLNGGVNHVYATAFAGGTLGAGSFVFPQGMYMGFEDLPRGGDFDYNDLTFVFANTRALGAPGPVAGAGLPALMALGAVLALRRRRRA